MWADSQLLFFVREDRYALVSILPSPYLEVRCITVLAVFGHLTYVMPSTEVVACSPQHDDPNALIPIHPHQQKRC